MRRLRAEPVGIVAVSLGVAAMGFLLPAVVSGEPPELWPVLSAAAGLPSLALGVALLWLRPHNRTGLLLALAGFVALLLAGVDNYLQVAQLLQETGTGSIPVNGASVAAAQGSWMLYYLPWAWLLLVFPSGAPANRLDRIVAAALPSIVVLFNLLAALGPVASPLPEANRDVALVPGADVVAVLLLPLFFGALLVCVVRFAVRFSHAPAAERVQMRWLAAAGALVPATLLLCWAGYLLGGSSDVVVVGLLLIYLLLPALVAVAVLRAELFDVDRVLAAGLVGTGLGAVALAVLAAIGGWAGAALGQESTAATAAATAVMVLLLLPVHKMLVRWVDRRLFPQRWLIMQSVAALEHDVYAGRALPEDLDIRLRAALSVPSLEVGYVLPGTGEVVDARGGAILPDTSAIAVVVAGEAVGFLDHVPELGHTGTPDRVLMAALARPMELVRLRLELSMALAEVEASRARILAAGYVERQRLERDLHDGAQQRLVALGMSLRLAQRHLGIEQHELHGVMDAAVAELGTVVAEIRQLAHGIRPSSLEAGLPAALEQLCHTAPFQVDLELRPAGNPEAAIPEMVGTTAYFVASEAVANAAKYAQASRIAVCLEHGGGVIRIGVRDNGGGGAVLRRGGGLAGLMDRVAAQGGTLQVLSPAGHGTLVEAELPCA
ncbi:sensor histidine kinase [Arthrobacter sp. PAMC 25486]|uniref:sensor histidine kinase n=1 Tax=Arthrobacter sp. PAMC 25486 TaxID=1494608 RepID=UPI00068A4EBD|nr:histidine kinase [Arthrobacter sp. PAMC 25486]